MWSNYPTFMGVVPPTRPRFGGAFLSRSQEKAPRLAAGRCSASCRSAVFEKGAQGGQPLRPLFSLPRVSPHAEGYKPTG